MDFAFERKASQWKLPESGHRNAGPGLRHPIPRGRFICAEPQGFFINRLTGEAISMFESGAVAAGFREAPLPLWVTNPPLNCAAGSSGTSGVPSQPWCECEFTRGLRRRKLYQEFLSTR